MKAQSDIETVFKKIKNEVSGLHIKKYKSTPGKIGLRTDKGHVVLTYNSYRKGWLDTRADLGPKLIWFRFKPTETKPENYWASELTPDRVKEIFQANHHEIISTLRFEHVGSHNRKSMEWSTDDILLEEIDGSLYVTQGDRKYKARDWKLSDHLVDIINLAVSYGIGCVWRKNHPQKRYFKGGGYFEEGSHHIGFSRSSGERWVFLIGGEAGPPEIRKITFEKHYGEFLKATKVEIDKATFGGKDFSVNPKDLKKILDYFNENGVIDEVEAMLNN